jgi:hypothetical protein
MMIDRGIYQPLSSAGYPEERGATVAIVYQVQRESDGILGQAVSSIEEAKRTIRTCGIPGVYVVYECDTGEIPGVYELVKGAQMVLTPGGRLWERRDVDPPKPYDYWREDGWSAYLSDQTALVWVYCNPDKMKVGDGRGSGPDKIDAVLARIDEKIAKAGAVG